MTHQAEYFEVDKQKCIRCGECVSDCPINILMIGDAPPTVADGREGDCVGCQHCFAVCPTGAITLNGLKAESSQELGQLPEMSADLRRLVMGRRSIRRFVDRNVQRQVIRELLETSWHAPSGRNCRRVHFTVVDDRLVMNQVRERTMTLLASRLDQQTPPPELDFLVDIVNGWRNFEVDVIFRWAPHLLVASAPADCASPEQDCLIALSYFDLLAQSQGIGTLWNGMVKTALIIVPELRSLLGIPDHHVIGYFMSFGFPAVRYARTALHQGVPIHQVAPLSSGA